MLEQKTTAAAKTTGNVPVERSLEALILLYGPALSRLINRLSGWQRADCEDLMQSVFVAAIGKLDQFDGRSALPTWLTAIAINAVRAERRRRLISAKHWLSMGRHRSAAADDRPTDEQSAITETRQRVVAAVRSLPAKYREVLVLRYLEEMCVDDVATALNLRKNTVEVRLHRAKQMLEAEQGKP